MEEEKIKYAFALLEREFKKAKKEKFPRTRQQRQNSNWFMEQVMENKYGSDWLTKIPAKEFTESFHCVVCGIQVEKLVYKRHLFLDPYQKITNMTCGECLDIPARRVSEHLLSDYN
jgi:hypothetical protein